MSAPPTTGRSRERGQGLVEFALVFPIIMLLVFGFIDVGRAVFAHSTLTNSARQGARVAIVNQGVPADGVYECRTNQPVEDPVNPRWTAIGCAMVAGTALGVTDADVMVSYHTPAGTSLECTSTINVGCLARVTVTHAFNPITPLANIVVGTISMTTTSEMPVERIFP